MTSTRQLAAIMFTDIVGYTALMGDNTEKALELVHISKGIQKPLVEKHDGKWLKEMGDGTLVRFSTALDAVNCAIEIQEQARATFDGKLRIGIHLGDITIEDEDVYGDGVNVASRLEGIADPGGIYISDAILKAVQGQSDIQTKYLGEIPLKNVAYDLRTYAIQGAGLPIPADVNKKPLKVSESKKKYPIWASIGAALVIIILAFYLYPKFFQEQAIEVIDIDEISIAVLPFKNFSGDPEHEPFCDGMTDAVITRLTKLEGITRVISRTTMMRFKETDASIPEIAAELGVTHILEANFQKSGDQLKVTLQLIDGPADNYYWSDQYIGEWGDIFGIQAAVAESVARNMGVQISENEFEKIQITLTDNEEAYQFYLQAMFLNTYLEENVKEALKLFEKAIQLDSGFVEAYLRIGFLKSWFGHGGQPSVSSSEEAFQTGIKYYTKALELKPNKAITHAYLGSHYLWYKWDFATADREYAYALRVDPYEGEPIEFLIAMERYEEALELVNREYEVDPLNGFVLARKLLAEYFSGNSEDLFSTIEIANSSDLQFLIFNLGRIYSYLGEYDKVISILVPFIGSNVPRNEAYISIAYHHLGNLVERDKLIKKFMERSNKSPFGSPSFYLAMIYAQMSEVDTAFEWLDKAYEDHEVEVYWLKVEPPFEPLHDDPRWKVMLDKVGFPE